MTYTYCVIDDNNDSYASAMDIRVRDLNVFTGYRVDEKLTIYSMLNFGVPVFFRGEILVLDASGREVNGYQRKPSKWPVRTSHFATFEAALAHAMKLR